jgi:hypothetical protein
MAKHLRRLKDMNVGDIWRDQTDDILLITSVKKKWAPMRRSLKHIAISAMILQSKDITSGTVIDGYDPLLIVEKLA